MGGVYVMRVCMIAWQLLSASVYMRVGVNCVAASMLGDGQGVGLASSVFSYLSIDRQYRTAC